MRKFFTCIIPVTVVIAFTGCNKENKYLRVDPSHVEVDSDQDHTLVEVSASASWMSYCTAGWIDSYMQDSETLRLNFERLDSLFSRTAEVSVITADALTFVISVTQRASDVDFSAYPKVLLFGSRDTDSQTIKVDSRNIEEWTYTYTEEWLTVSRPSDVNDYSQNKLIISVSSNKELAARTDTIVIAPSLDAFSSLADTVTVVQRGSSILVENAGIDENGLIEISAETTQVVLEIYAKATWSVTTNDNGNRIKLNISGGEANVDEDGFELTDDDGVSLAPTNLVVTLPENTSDTEFSYLISFTCTDEAYEYVLVQAASMESEP